jgi:hypothetical protein
LRLKLLQKLILLLQQFKLLKVGLFVIFVHFVDKIVFVEIVLVLFCEFSGDFFDVLRADFGLELFKLFFVVFELFLNFVYSGLFG